MEKRDNGGEIPVVKYDESLPALASGNARQTKPSGSDELEKYSDDQKRDYHGRWTSVGGSALSSKLKNIAKGDIEKPRDAQDRKVAAMLVKDGRLFPTKKMGHTLNWKGTCHQNVAMLYDTKKFPVEKFGIATGYVNGPGSFGKSVWVSHSWLYNRSSGAIIETTGSLGQRAYFGIALKTGEIAKFTRTGGKL